MTVTYRNGVAILQVVAYVPILILAFLLCLRHGFARSSGWFFLIALSIIRLVGASCWLAYISYPLVGVITAAIICTSIGIAPLTLLCSGLLSRVNDSTTHSLPTQIFGFMNLISLIGLILGIIGGVTASQSSTPFILNNESKAAIIIFTCVFLAVVCILIILSLRISQVKRGERRLLLAVAISSPFIATRLIYALISVFAENPNFNASFGNVTIYLCMAVLEEIIVALICIRVGFTISVVQRDETSAVVKQERGIEDPERPGKFKTTTVSRTARRRTKKGGPITWLFRIARDYYRSRKAEV